MLRVETMVGTGQMYLNLSVGMVSCRQYTVKYNYRNIEIRFKREKYHVSREIFLYNEEM